MSHTQENYDELKKEYEENKLKFEKLQRLAANIKANELTSELLEECPELANKLTEVKKLKYRVDIMKRSLGENEADSKKTKKVVPPPQEVKYVKVDEYGDAILEKLTSIFAATVKKLYPDVSVNIQLRETSSPKFGDYQFDSSTVISRQLSTPEHPVKPNEVAAKIIEALPKESFIDKVALASVFINIYLNRVEVGKRITNGFRKGINKPTIQKRKVCIDFSSPNIAKQMHVGHLRSTIIGESFARLFEFVGFDVSRINHIGDWGTQFGMLIAHLQDQFPKFETETPPIADLQAFYKESKKRFDEDEEFKKRAYECVVKLQSHDPVFINAWKLICDVSRKDFSRIYERLDVKIEERGESFYQDRMVSLVKEFEEKGLLTEDEGRKIFWPKNANIPLTVVKSDGGYTYDTSDMATIRHRLFEEKGDWLIYVVDRGQAEHFETIYAAARDLEWYDPSVARVEHVQFGVVLGEDKKKFKTRSGDTVRLTDLLDEGVRRAEAKLIEKGRDKEMSAEELEKAKEAVAYGCIRYADLSHGRNNDYIFSFDRMLDDRGNTAVYLLYAYARIRSIARTADVTAEQIHSYVDSLADGILPLDHEREFKLAKHLLKFSDTILVVLESLQLHKLCDYVHALATLFHDFYKECYVVHKEKDGSTVINYHRVVLCEVTADVMAKCFGILGIRPVERM